MSTEYFYHFILDGPHSGVAAFRTGSAAIPTLLDAVVILRATRVLVVVHHQLRPPSNRYYKHRFSYKRRCFKDRLKVY